MTRYDRAWVLALACMLWLGTSAALALEAPTGDVVLVVKGQLTHTNVGDEAHFDKAMLDALEQGTIDTHTPWHDGRVSFSGRWVKPCSLLWAQGGVCSE